MGIQHKLSRLMIRNVPVALDEGVCTMWTFNNGLYSRMNGLAPAVAGATDWEKKLEIDRMRQAIESHGKHGNGIKIEEGTTNLLGDISTFIVVDGNNTITMATYSEKYGDSTIVKVTKAATAPSGWASFRKGFSCTASTKYTVSWKLKILQGSLSSIGTHFNGSTTATTSYYPIGDGWYQFYYTGTASTTALNCGVGFIGNAYGEFLVTEPQCELKLIHTSFTSSSRSSEYLKYILPNSIKTVSFWFRSDINEEISEGTPRVLLAQSTANGVNTTTDPYWLCYITKTTETIKDIVCLKLATPTVSYFCTVNKNVLDGEWHYVVIEFNVTPTSEFSISNTASRLWVDGEYAETALEEQLNTDGSRKAGPFTGYTTPFLFYSDSNPFYFRVGHQDDSGEYLAMSNCIYDDIITYTSLYDKDTVLSWYASNAEPYLPYDYSIDAQEDYRRIPVGAFTYDDMGKLAYYQLFEFTHDRLEGK